MTPAQIQQLVYLGVISFREYISPHLFVSSLLQRQRHKLPQGCGWELCSLSGATPTPSGAILIGAVIFPNTDEEDLNLYVYPVTSQAMVLCSKTRVS